MPPAVDSLADTLITAAKATTSPVFSITITAEAVAWYGAIVATLAFLVAAIGLALNAYNILRDRPNIHVAARANYRLTASAARLGYDVTKDFIAITVSNKGRRPATISQVYLQLKSGKSIVAADSLRRGSQVLSESTAPVTYPIEQDQVRFDDIDYPAAIDQTGKIWKGTFDPNPPKPAKPS
jgi:hypothetical protein